MCWSYSAGKRVTASVLANPLLLTAHASHVSWALRYVMGKNNLQIYSFIRKLFLAGDIALFISGTPGKFSCNSWNNFTDPRRCVHFKMFFGGVKTEAQQLDVITLVLDVCLNKFSFTCSSFAKSPLFEVKKIDWLWIRWIKKPYILFCHHPECENIIAVEI